MDPVTGLLISEAMKLALQGIFSLAEMAGAKPEDIDRIYEETKVAYAEAKKALG